MIPGSANPLLLASAAEAGAYQIERSLRFNSSDSAYLGATFGTPTDQDVFTLSMWVKRSALGSTQQLFGVSTNHSFGFTSGDALNLTFGGSSALTTTALFRDPSAWYHIVWKQNANAHELYVNGVSVGTATATSNTFNTAVAHQIGAANTTNYFNGCLADCFLIDGQALDPTSFGEFDADTGIWNPIEYTGDYGLVSVANATGALPIYNTTDTYGTVKGTGTRTDANASSLVLAIPMDGANNGTTFTDESATIKGSGSAKIVTASGDAQTSTTQSKWYGSSGAFDGTGDYLSVASDGDFALGTGDFTVEFWYYHISGKDRGLFANNSGASVGVNFLVGAGGPFRIYNGTSANNLYDFSASPTANAWQHLAVVRNSGTLTLYVNGVASGSTNWSGVNAGNTATFSVGSAYGNARYANGYMQDFRLYKGTAKYTSDFNPVVSSNNSFHLPFDDNSSAAALGTDTSGNSNTWTVNNISVAAGAGNDSLVDVPTNGTETDTGVGGEVRGNYATLNPLANSGLTLSNGNLDFTSDASNRDTCISTIAVSSGKWYWELTVDGSSNTIGVGIEPLGYYPASDSRTGQDSAGYAWWLDRQQKWHNNASASYGASVPNDAVIGVALDLDAGTLTFYLNNSSQGVAYSGISGTYLPAVCDVSTASSGAGFLNFGQRPFAYTAPSGFKALCTANLPAPVVTKPSEYMDVALYTGNGSTQTISGLEFSPDLVWAKIRSATSFHRLHDSVRGSDNTLASNATDAEVVGNGIVSFTSDGWEMDASTNINQSFPYVAWTWDAGDSTVTNTDGSITSQVRANPSAGFSIVTYTGNGTGGATVGHGLGATCQFIVVKRRDSAQPWLVLHTSVGLTGDTTFGLAEYYMLHLNQTSARQNYSQDLIFPGNSTTFALGSGGTGYSNANGGNYVAYCFAPVAGYSNGFSYTGNGSTDGSFVYLGFRPRLILLKCSSTTGNWTLLDTAREGYNVDNDPLYPNLSNAEGTTDLLDITSNGFKLRTTDASVNSNAATYIGFAWAESPFNYSRAR